MSLAGVARVVRRFCLDCQGGSPVSVASCRDVECPFFPMRELKSEPERNSEDLTCANAAPAVEKNVEPEPELIKGAAENIRPLRLIRAYCLRCAGSRQDVRECEAKDGCSLWSYRFGVKPTTFKRVSSRVKNERQSLKLPGL